MATLNIAAGTSYTRAIECLLQQVGARFECSEQSKLTTPHLVYPHKDDRDWVRVAKDLASVIGKRLELDYGDLCWRLYDAPEFSVPVLPRPWSRLARPNQLPPEGDWSIYLITAGRGWGKTRAGAEWTAEQAATRPGTHWVVVAPTWRDCKKLCIEGETGILRALPPGELDSVNLSTLTVKLKNGSTISGHSYDGLRERDILRDAVDGVWIDEVATMPDFGVVWDNLLAPAMKGGAKTFITTTPRAAKFLTRLVESDDPTVVHVRGTTWENSRNLSKYTLAQLRSRYEGTDEYWTEILGEVPSGRKAPDTLESRHKQDRLLKFELACLMREPNVDSLMATITSSQWREWKEYLQSRKAA